MFGERHHPCDSTSCKLASTSHGHWTVGLFGASMYLLQIIFVMRDAVSMPNGPNGPLPGASGSEIIYISGGAGCCLWKLRLQELIVRGNRRGRTSGPPFERKNPLSIIYLMSGYGSHFLNDWRTGSPGWKC